MANKMTKAAPATSKPVKPNSKAKPKAAAKKHTIRFVPLGGAAIGTTKSAPATTPKRFVIKKPGIYPGITPAAYHADPCIEPSLSASFLKVVDEESPRHARLRHPRLNTTYSERPTKGMDFGTVAHAELLGTPEYHVVNALNWKTSAAQVTRERCRAAGIPCALLSDVAKIKPMSAIVRAQVGAVIINGKPIGDIFGCKAGVPEATAVWRDDGVWCRARADWWLPPSAMKRWPRGLIVDYKTTFDASPEEWSSTAFKIGADFQESWYRPGFALAQQQSNAKPRMAVDAPDFLFIVQEPEPPFEFQCFMMDEVSRTHAESKMIRAFHTVAPLMLPGVPADSWPGYARELAYLSPPPWDVKKEERRTLLAAVMAKPL